jgi:pimeloyl-ACP methyl ester carboxylesterase
MLGPSYPDVPVAVEAFRARGYNATPWTARSGRRGHANQVFLVSRTGSNRLYVVIRGTDNFGDVVQDLKAKAYTATYADGQFYIPPGHGGFRRGMLNIIGSGLLRSGEFDERPLDCGGLNARASVLAKHLCRYGMPTGPGQVELILVGHSLGAGIAQVGAAAFAGLEFVKVPGGTMTVARQKYWPLTLRAVVAFAPPLAVYSKTDIEAGIAVPAGIENQWSVLESHGIIGRTILFINDRDLVPALSVGYGRHFGHRFRVDRDDRVTFDGTTTARDLNVAQAHTNVGYCTAVLKELKQPVVCD